MRTEQYQLLEKYLEGLTPTQATEEEEIFWKNNKLQETIPHIRRANE